ncbi:MAG: hypothetical protein Fur0018_25110 [Anaerolineales bacterium]
MHPIVMKFGGTSLGSPLALDNVRRIVQQAVRNGAPLVLVVSAAAGVTDALQAVLSQPQEGGAALQAIRSCLRQLAAGVLHCQAARRHFEAILQAHITEGETLHARAQCADADLPRLSARMLSLGERVQVHLVSALLQQAGLAARPCNAADGLVLAQEGFPAAEVLWPPTAEGLRAHLRPMLDAGQIPVVTGFVAATPRGEITTLGRNGSDYSAALVGAALQALEVQVWTDVDGLYSADPRRCPEAYLLPRVSYRQAYAMALGGARVLHPKTLLPLAKAGIPLWVRNTWKPEAGGTRIHGECGIVPHPRSLSQRARGVEAECRIVPHPLPIPLMGRGV